MLHWASTVPMLIAPLLSAGPGADPLAGRRGGHGIPAQPQRAACEWLTAATATARLSVPTELLIFYQYAFARRAGRRGPCPPSCLPSLLCALPCVCSGARMVAHTLTARARCCLCVCVCAAGRPEAGQCAHQARAGRTLRARCQSQRLWALTCPPDWAVSQEHADFWHTQPHRTGAAAAWEAEPRRWEPALLLVLFWLFVFFYGDCVASLRGTAAEWAAASGHARHAYQRLPALCCPCLCSRRQRLESAQRSCAVLVQCRWILNAIDHFFAQATSSHLQS